MYCHVYSNKRVLPLPLVDGRVARMHWSIMEHTSFRVRQPWAWITAMSLISFVTQANYLISQCLSIICQRGILIYAFNKALCLVAQSCPTLYDPMDCSQPGSFGHGDSLGKNTGVGSLSLVQGIFLTQESNQRLLHCRWILYQLSYQGSPKKVLSRPYL